MLAAGMSDTLLSKDKKFSSLLCSFPFWMTAFTAASVRPHTGRILGTVRGMGEFVGLLAGRRMTWTLEPPNPKELIPTMPPRTGMGRSMTWTRPSVRAGMSGLGWVKCRLGAQTPRSRDRTTWGKDENICDCRGDDNTLEFLAQASYLSISTQTGSQTKKFEKPLLGFSDTDQRFPISVSSLMVRGFLICSPLPGQPDLKQVLDGPCWIWWSQSAGALALPDRKHWRSHSPPVGLRPASRKQRCSRDKIILVTYSRQMRKEQCVVMQHLNRLRRWMVFLWHHKLCINLCSSAVGFDVLHLFRGHIGLVIERTNQSLLHVTRRKRYTWGNKRPIRKPKRKPGK